ncbi:MAG: helix-turn-helix transcriptional regulator [bacterium]
MTSHSEVERMYMLSNEAFSPSWGALSPSWEFLESEPDLRLLTYDELIHRTGLNRKTIDEWRNNWGFPYIQQDDHCQIYFPVGEIKRWIRSRVKQSASKSDEPDRDDVVGEIQEQSILQ